MLEKELRKDAVVALTKVMGKGYAIYQVYGPEVLLLNPSVPEETKVITEKVMKAQLQFESSQNQDKAFGLVKPSPSTMSARSTLDALASKLIKILDESELC